MKRKFFFITEIILIAVSGFAFILSLYTKKLGTEKFDSLELKLTSLQLQYVCNNDVINLQETSKNLESDYLPFTYFNKDIAECLSGVIELLNNTSPSKEDSDLFVSRIFNLQNLMRSKQSQLETGYDMLIFSAFFLIFITALVVIYKNVLQRNELTKIKNYNEANRKFSRELHDGAAQDLAALKLYLNQNDVEKSKFYAEQAFNEVRFLIDSLHLDMTSDFKTIIQKMLTNFEQNYGINTNLLFASEKIKAVSNDIKVELFRILQEALNNTAKHSEATLASVKIIDSPDSIHFVISDNGIGISPEILSATSNDSTTGTSETARDQRNHYGLQNIKERTEAFGGTVEFSSEGGTTIAITIKDFVR